MYLRVASANTNWHSVLTFILATPKDIASFIISSGIPVPPCNTKGISPVASFIFPNASKFKPAQFSGYWPCILPIPAAKKSIPNSAIALHSWGSAISPAPTTPSSSPPIEPTSASIDIPFEWANSTNSLVLATFSSNG